MNLKGYLFNGSDNTRYDSKNNKADANYPAVMSKDWPGLPSEFQSDLDDVVNLNDALFFFKGSKYLKFDIKKAKVVEGPKAIVEGWPALKEFGFETGVDAATEWAVWGEGTSEPNAEYVLFFKGDQCVTYNLSSHVADKKAITDKFPDLKKSAYGDFSRDLDTVLLWNNEKAYFFKGDEYIRYDLKTNVFDMNPTAISKYWNGVAQHKIQASVLFDLSILGVQPDPVVPVSPGGIGSIPDLPQKTNFTVTLVNNEDWVRTAVLNIDGKDVSMEVNAHQAISKQFISSTNGPTTITMYDSKKNDAGGMMIIPALVSTSLDFAGKVGRTVAFGAEKKGVKDHMEDEKYHGLDVIVHIDWMTNINQ